MRLLGSDVNPRSRISLGSQDPRHGFHEPLPLGSRRKELLAVQWSEPVVLGPDRGSRCPPGTPGRTGARGIAKFRRSGWGRFAGCAGSGLRGCLGRSSSLSSGPSTVDILRDDGSEGWKCQAGRHWEFPRCRQRWPAPDGPDKRRARNEPPTPFCPPAVGRRKRLPHLLILTASSAVRV